MVVHTVLMQLKPGVSSEELGELTERLRSLATAVAGPGSSTVGPNTSEEPLDQGFDFGFVLRFASHAALDAYHVNPAHLAVSLAIRNLAETILVFDFAG